MDYYYIFSMYHIFLTYSYAIGHLGCVHLLITLNDVMINMGVKHLFIAYVQFSFDMYSEVGLPDCIY